MNIYLIKDMLRYSQYTFFTFLIFLIETKICTAQVGINTETPDPSSALDIQDKERGLLIPRMENADRQNIQNANTAANALLVFDTQDKKFYFFDKAAGVWSAVNMWVSSDDVTRTDEPAYYNGEGNVGIGTTTPGSKLTIGGNLAVGSAPAFMSYPAPPNGMIVQGRVGIGSINPQASLHVAGTNSIIIPAGSNTQRPETDHNGAMRYNTSSQGLEVNNGYGWNSIVPAGTILPYGGATVPAGWLLCDGRSFPAANYPNLFGAIGNDWGGNGGNFNIPDLRGMFLRGVGGNSNNDPDKLDRVASAPGGNTGNAVGSKQQDDFLSHDHEITDPGHSHQYWDEYNPPRNSDNASDRWVADDQTVETEKSTDPANTGISINPRGGNETRPKNVYVNYIIKY